VASNQDSATFSEDNINRVFSTFPLLKEAPAFKGLTTSWDTASLADVSGGGGSGGGGEEEEDMVMCLFGSRCAHPPPSSSSSSLLPPPPSLP